MYRYTMRPYTVAGITYTPIIPHVGQTFKGIASWYGPSFHGKLTSNGEYYDMHTATAAHKTLPMNTIVKVTNLNTGANTIVRINDRGPFVQGRIIDLSRLAAAELGIVDKGTAEVKIEVLEFDKTAKAFATQSNRAQTPTQLLQQRRAIAQMQTKKGIYKVQVLSTHDKTKAQEFVEKYDTMNTPFSATIERKKFWQKTTYKVYIGYFKTINEAKNFIANNQYYGAFVAKD